MGLGAMQTLNTAGITAAATEGLRMLRMGGRKCNCTHKDLEGSNSGKIRIQFIQVPMYLRDILLLETHLHLRYSFEHSPSRWCRATFPWNRVAKQNATQHWGQRISCFPVLRWSKLECAGCRFVNMNSESGSKLL